MRQPNRASFSRKCPQSATVRHRETTAAFGDDTHQLVAHRSESRDLRLDIRQVRAGDPAESTAIAAVPGEDDRVDLQHPRDRLNRF